MKIDPNKIVEVAEEVVEAVQDVQHTDTPAEAPEHKSFGELNTLGKVIYGLKLVGRNWRIVSLLLGLVGLGSVSGVLDPVVTGVCSTTTICAE